MTMPITFKSIRRNMGGVLNELFGTRRRKPQSRQLSTCPLTVEFLETRLAPSATPVVAIAAGHASSPAAGWSADEYYSGTSSTYAVTNTINTSSVVDPAPAAVYQSERFGTSFTYTIPGLTAGAAYTVRLDFSENYFSAVGKRAFNVSINSNPALTNFDIFAATGATDKAIDEDFIANASSSGAITIGFTATLNEAKIDGIEIYQATPAVDINAGGGAVGSFVADRDYSGTTSPYVVTNTINTSSVIDPAPAAVYQSERYGTSFLYTIPNLTPGGSYTVRLDFSENYFTAVAKREFNVSINGNQVLTNFDIFAATGATYKAIDENFTADASSSGAIAISFTATVNDAKIDGIEVLQSNSSDWFSQHLGDPLLQNLVRTDVNRDGSLTRADLIGTGGVFATVEGEGTTISPTDFTDLQTLANPSNNTTLKMTPDVANLLYKVVDGNPANLWVTGDPTGSLTPGNLAANSTDSVLVTLVDKWFLGQDHPATSDVAGLTYKPAAGQLWGTSGPVYTDIVQGEEGDCYLLSAMGEIDFRSPTDIESLVVNGLQGNGDGTYTVKFINYSGAPEYITVDSMFPAYSNGTFAYANLGKSLSNANNKLWVPVIEKAYVQLAAEGWTRNTNSPNDYHSIDFGWEGAAENQLLGISASANNLVSTSEQAILTAFNNGHLVNLDTDSTTAKGIVPSHVYMVTGYNAATDTFTLYNPWGYPQSLTWATIVANFYSWTDAVLPG